MKVLSFNTIHHQTNFPYSRDFQTNEMLVTEALQTVKFYENRKFISVYQYLLPHPVPEYTDWTEPWLEIHTDLPYLYIDETTGHIQRKFLRFRYRDDIQLSCAFIAEHFDALQLTPEVIQFLYEHLLEELRFAYPSEVAADQLLLLLQPVYELLRQGINTGENVFDQIAAQLVTIEQALPRLN